MCVFAHIFIYILLRIDGWISLLLYCMFENMSSFCQYHIFISTPSSNYSPTSIHNYITLHCINFEILKTCFPERVPRYSYNIKKYIIVGPE